MAKAAKICEHTFGSGDRCGALATRDQRYCRYHLRYQRKNDLGSPDYEMPDLEDGDSIQLLINEVIRGLIKGNLDQKKATAILYGAQIASNNIRHWETIEVDEEDDESEAQEEKVPIMVKLLTEALADLKVHGGPDHGRPANEVFQEKMKEVLIENE